MAETKRITDTAFINRMREVLNKGTVDGKEDRKYSDADYDVLAGADGTVSYDDIVQAAKWHYKSLLPNNATPVQERFAEKEEKLFIRLVDKYVYEGKNKNEEFTKEEFEERFKGLGIIPVLTPEEVRIMKRGFNVDGGSTPIKGGFTTKDLLLLDTDKTNNHRNVLHYSFSELSDALATEKKVVKQQVTRPKDTFHLSIEDARQFNNILKEHVFEGKAFEEGSELPLPKLLEKLQELEINLDQDSSPKKGPSKGSQGRKR